MPSRPGKVDARMMKHLVAVTAGMATAAWLIGAHPAQAADPIKLKVGTQSLIDTAPFEAAKAQGYFLAEGLDVEATSMVGGAATLPALAAGQIQIAASNMVSILLSAEQGFEFKIIAAGDTTADAPPDLAGMVTKPNLVLTSGSDLEGKRLAVNTRKDGIWLYARQWVMKTGGNPDRVTYVEVPFPQMIDAVQQGRVDAAFVVEPFLSAGVKSDTVHVVAWPYSAVLSHAPIMEWVAAKAVIEANPDLIDRFSRAYNKGADWMTRNKGSAEWVQLISSYTHIASDLVQHVSPPLFPTTVDPAQIAKVAAIMRKEGLLKDAGVNTDDLLYRTVLPHAQ
jgi:NitT/TauT family transport system substrate-binding protein